MNPAPRRVVKHDIGSRYRPIVRVDRTIFSIAALTKRIRMNPQLEVAYTRFEQLGNETLRMLPGAGIAIFILFLFAAHWIRKFVQHLNARRFQHNLVLVLGRIAQWGIILLGLLLAIAIAFPSFTPANLISALGITGIAIGFALQGYL
ncbi:hypothetical protein [Massilia glaciei]|uniref:hypothetical protein n=1 Tax=Massilia glaciei TaxID=1524097 RepID=UPI001E45E356|nr:hypothetical protein [Massilia glaciei]